MSETPFDTPDMGPSLNQTVEIQDSKESNGKENLVKLLTNEEKMKPIISKFFNFK